MGGHWQAQLLGPLLTQEPALKHFLHPTQLLAAVSPPPPCWGPPIGLPVSSLSPLHPEGSLEKKVIPLLETCCGSCLISGENPAPQASTSGLYNPASITIRIPP